MRPCACHSARHRREIVLDAGGGLVALLGGLGEQLHDEPETGGGMLSSR